MNTSSSVDQVTIEPSGKWSVQAVQPEEQTTPKETSFVDDDDLVISETNFVGARGLVTPNRSTTNFETPVRGSRESSTMARSATSNKRPAAEVIDLTLSDDDEPPDRPAKRQNTGTNTWGNVIF